ncbi:ribonuclease J [Mycoplasma sp. 1654_15]|uniref:ribonuclease J n=1 Tax=Mycoplasma sp. 1654_15 TaxID=2725994 RepID=UPI001449A4D4|nr:ribonuclease J [Mycoplasma sp. 1654_15]QJB71495.1 ribonuclease J [Mycoplasma sp. 1654_15]
MAKISFFALGGQDENGKNSYVLEIDNSIFLINTGAKIPLSNSLGIDTVIPDFSYIEENFSRVQGVFLTDAKNESFSALPWLIMKVPKLKIFCSSFTKALILERLTKYKISNNQYEIVSLTKKIKIDDDVYVKPIQLAGSIPGIYGYNFETEDGLILFLSNFIVGNLGIYGNTNLNFLKKSLESDKPILMTMIDSSRANYPGKTIDKIFAKKFLEQTFLTTKSNSRIIVGAYDEEMLSIQEILDLAYKYKRKVATYGRNYDNLLEMNQRLAEKQKLDIHYPEFFDFRQANKIDNSVILITSTPERIYQRFFRILEKDDVFFKLKKTDSVIMLAPPINGMEVLHSRVLDEIAKVARQLVDITETQFYRTRPSQEDIYEVLKVLKPKFFLPIQGLYRYLVVAGKTAERAGVKKENIIILQNKKVAFFLDGELISQKHSIKNGGEVIVDGFGVGDISTEVIKERETLSRDGTIVVSALLDTQTKKLISELIISSYGILTKDNKEKVHKIINDVVFTQFSAVSKTKMSDNQIKEIQEKIQKSIKRKIFKAIDKEPVIIVAFYENY